MTLGMLGVVQGGLVLLTDLYVEQYTGPVDLGAAPPNQFVNVKDPANPEAGKTMADRRSQNERLRNRRRRPSASASSAARSVCACESSSYSTAGSSRTVVTSVIVGR